MEQFFIFLRRNVLRKLTNQQYLLITFLEAPLLSLIAAWFTRYTDSVGPFGTYVFRENMNIPVYMFIGVIVSMFLGLMVSAKEIFMDRKIQERESFLNLSRLSYLHSKILVLFVISAVQTFLFLLVGNLILEIRGMFFHYWAILFSIACLANVIGLNFSAGLNSVATAYIVIPFLVVPQLLFSGVMIPYDRLNTLLHHPEYVPVIGELMPSRWAYEAVAVHQFKGNRFTREFFKMDQTIGNVNYQRNRVQLMEETLNNINFLLSKGLRLESSEDDLMLVQNELKDMAQAGFVASFGAPEGFTTSGFNEEVYQSAMDSLALYDAYMMEAGRKASQMKNQKVKEMTEIWRGEDGYLEMNRKYTNKSLDDLLRYNRRYFQEWDHHLVREYAPIYQIPRSRVGRAQLYAPVKVLGSLHVDTYWFNLAVLWLLSVLFYLALMNDLLRKLVNWNDIRKLREKS